MLKTLLTASLLTLSSTIFAFTPTSGMVLTCYDSVSSYTYKLTLVDLGDEKASIEVINRKGKKIETYKKAVFNEHATGSFFLAYKNCEEAFSVNFPYNDIYEAYFEDRGDTRALDCQVVKN